MVVDSVIGNTASVTPVIDPSQLSVAVGAVNSVISHWAVRVAKVCWSTTGDSVSEFDPQGSKFSFISTVTASGSLVQL